MAARRRTHGVRVPALETPNRIVVAKPSGVVTEHVFTGPVQVRRAGTWVPFSSALVKTTSGWRTKATPVSIHVASGNTAGSRATRIPTSGVESPTAPTTSTTTQSATSSDLASLTTQNGSVLVVRWPGGLPAATVSGNTATYKNVAPGFDIKVSAYGNAFELSAILTQRPTKPLSLTLPMRLTGLSVSQGADGLLHFSDGSGDEVASSSGVTMSGAAIDPRSGDPVRSVHVPFTLTQTADGPSISFTPDWSFLSDPATTYPVTIDPTYSDDESNANGYDTYTYLADPTTAEGSYDSTNVLKIGSFDGGTDRAGSYLWFNIGSLNNSDWTVNSASLRLYNYYSYSCYNSSLTPSTRIYGADTPKFTRSGTTWNNQPYSDKKVYVDSQDFSWGYSSSCAGRNVTFDAQPLAQRWSNGTEVNNGIYLTTSDNTNSYGWKKFYNGASASTATQKPQLTISYDTNCDYYPSTGKEVCGAIRTEYDNRGGPTGPLGNPTSNVRTAGSSPQGTTGTFQSFENGMIMSSSKGTFATIGAYSTEYNSLSPSGTTSALGFPIADQRTASASPQGTSGTYQRFEGGEIDSSAKGTFTVSGAKFTEFIAQSPAGTGSALGFPTSEQRTAAASPQGTTGTLQPFEGGQIDSSSKGTFAVVSALNTEYNNAAPAGTGSSLGFPTGDQAVAAASTSGTTGKAQAFEAGVIDSSSLGTYRVLGTNNTDYSNSGGSGGVLGFPTADAATATASPAGTSGTVQSFESGEIFAGSGLPGSSYVAGAVRTLFDDIGSTGSCLGFPVGDQHAASFGQEADFQGGSITLDGASGSTGTTCHAASGDDIAPNRPSGMALAPCSSACADPMLANSVTPSLSAAFADVDSSSLRADFQVWTDQTDGSAQVASTSVNGIAAGATATWLVPPSTLDNSRRYKFRVRAWDGTVFGPWSVWTHFTTDVPSSPTSLIVDTSGTSPALSGVVSIPSGTPVTAHFFVTQAGAPVTGAYDVTVETPSGSRAAFAIPDGTLQSGTSYDWYMTACEGAACSSPTATQAFQAGSSGSGGTGVTQVVIPAPSIDDLTFAADAAGCSGSPCPLVRDDRLRVGYDGSNKWRGYLHFDTSAVPTDSEVQSATLALGAAGCLAACSNYTVDLHRMLTQVASTDTGADAAQRIDADVETSFSSDAATIDVTSLVQDWLSSGEVNPGIALTLTNESTATSGVWFNSSRSAASHPVLTITYRTPRPPSTPTTLTASPGDRGAVLTWSAPDDAGAASAVPSYIVHVYDSAGNQVQSLTADDAQAVVTGLTDGVVYSFDVTASTTYGASSPASRVTFTPATISQSSSYKAAAEDYVRARENLLAGASTSVNAAASASPYGNAFVGKLQAELPTINRGKSIVQSAGIYFTAPAVTFSDELVALSSNGTPTMYLTMTSQRTEDFPNGTTAPSQFSDSEAISFSGSTVSTASGTALRPVLSRAGEAAVLAKKATTDYVTTGPGMQPVADSGTAALVDAQSLPVDGTSSAESVLATQSSYNNYPADLSGITTYALNHAYSSNYGSGDDCTRFASYSLHFGGSEPYISTHFWNRADDHKWYHSSYFGYSPWNTYSWGGAYNLYHNMQLTGRGRFVRYFSHVHPGYLLSFELFGDGHIDHTAIASKVFVIGMIGTSKIYDIEWAQHSRGAQYDDYFDALQRFPNMVIHPIQVYYHAMILA